MLGPRCPSKCYSVLYDVYDCMNDENPTAGSVQLFVKHILLVVVSLVPFLAIFTITLLFDPDPFWWFIAGAIGISFMDRTYHTVQMKTDIW